MYTDVQRGGEVAAGQWQASALLGGGSEKKKKGVLFASRNGLLMGLKGQRQQQGHLSE